MSNGQELLATDIEGYLKVHENKDMLRFLTCGSVDDGKSTHGCCCMFSLCNPL